MNILMIGSGYVGLVTGTCFAEMGHHVICLDIDEKKIEGLKKGIVPIYEPGLEEQILRNIKAGRLSFSTDYKSSVENSDVLFIAVPTPSREDGSCNTSYIVSASKEIARYIRPNQIVVNKSTAPVGTVELIKKTINDSLEKEMPFDVASNPEFLKEGSAISDCMKPDRIIIGVSTSEAEKTLKEIYAPFMINHERVISMDVRSAELTKYAANAMLATRISFMNELAEIAKRVGADINEIRKGIGSDARIGHSFLYAGIGYGGSCFPKDIRALAALSEKNGFEPALLKSVESVNNRQKKLMGSLLKGYFEEEGGVNGKTIAIWGLSFKPDTDDIREAPAITLIRELQKKGAILRLYDPVAMENVKDELGTLSNITFCTDEFDAAKDAHAVCLLTEWKQFRLLDFGKVADQMKTHAIFDGRNQYQGKELFKKGFDYIGIGMPDKRN